MFQLVSMWQVLGWLLVFFGLIGLNEVARRTKVGGVSIFIALPIALTIYFIAIYIAASQGANWALSNQTYVHMNSWFHYAKLYAATIGCVGFMMLKYEWGIGKKQWFKPWPFVIVAINILIAVASDFESFAKGGVSGGWWYSSEGVWVYGGVWNLLNGIAGIINILCMTGWWGIYSSKDRKDMLWPDMTWCFILAYDVWNFEYTYLNLPTHAWYCGLALLLAPTVANAMWNKGGWIQNRANTLSLWCMFAQVFPLFQDCSVFTTLPSVYPAEYLGQLKAAVSSGNTIPMPNGANPTWQLVIAIASIAINIAVFAEIMRRARKFKKNPYRNEIFTDQKDFKEAMARRA